jgi:hypothetical protein
VAYQPHRQYFLLAVGLIKDSIITHTQFEYALEGPGEGFRLNGVKILGEPIKSFQHTVSHRLVELSKVLGRSGTKLDLIHLPIQTATASHFGGWNILVMLLGILKFRPQAFPDLGPQSEACSRVIKNLAQFFLHDFADDRPQLLHRKVLDRLHRQFLPSLFYTSGARSTKRA